MSDVREVDHIHINEDLAFLRKDWRVQRIGWVVVALIILLGLVGVFGRGPAAHKQIGDPRTLAASFDGVVRHGALTEVTVTVGDFQPDSVFRLFLSGEYLRSFEIVDIIPEPSAAGLSGHFVFYEFRRTTRGPVNVVFHINPDGYWQQVGRIGLAGTGPLRFSQFVLP
ncbi:MAG: hypothetical protein ACT4O1_15330 [Gemmatimonadota bacterium]